MSYNGQDSPPEQRIIPFEMSIVAGLRSQAKRMIILERKKQ
jgi:hypothetical protein